MSDEPAAVHAWHRVFESKDAGLLDVLLADDVVFRSPAVFAPQEGKAITPEAPNRFFDRRLLIPGHSANRGGRFLANTAIVRWSLRFAAGDTMRRIVLALVAASALVVQTVVASNAAGTVPGRNGRVTFMRQDAAGFWQVWVARYDLSAAQQLTSGNADSGWPVWSPDGKKIAFDSNRTDPELADAVVINDVFIMNPDGSGLRKLTASHGFSGDAAWSPDGASIAFESDFGDIPQGIYVMRRDGTHVRPITAGLDSAARFSPDGEQLVFTRSGPGNQEFANSALFTVQLSGRHPHQLTPFGIGAGDADWSPNGKRIVFEASPTASSRGDVFVVNTNGRHLRNLTHNPATTGSADPVWSPDGTKILFLQAFFAANPFTAGLATMRPDGTNRHFISSTPVESHQPDWQTISRAHGPHG